MPAKLTPKNQITLPESVTSSFQGTEYFEGTNESGRIILTPVHPSRAGAVRSKLADLGLSEAEVGKAVVWARRTQRFHGEVQFLSLA